jgi:hypothetical protein
MAMRINKLAFVLNANMVFIMASQFMSAYVIAAEGVRVEVSVEELARLLLLGAGLGHLRRSLGVTIDNYRVGTHFAQLACYCVDSSSLAIAALDRDLRNGVLLAHK